MHIARTLAHIINIRRKAGAAQVHLLMQKYAHTLRGGAHPDVLFQVVEAVLKRDREKRMAQLNKEDETILPLIAQFL